VVLFIIMTKIFLLDHKSGIFQSFQDANQFYGFLQRCSRNLLGKTLIIRNGDKAKAVDLEKQSPLEINVLVIKLQNEIK
jgi:hypothetical protein